ncbi:hypothetical protein EDC04DRAFT_2601013 [Pisolithus marmoratus]|nr:hypothetical protein EDC04DRAFT_2601013 [Pisolithus marmoratus]
MESRRCWNENKFTMVWVDDVKKVWTCDYVEEFPKARDDFTGPGFRTDRLYKHTGSFFFRIIAELFTTQFSASDRMIPSHHGDDRNHGSNTSLHPLMHTLYIFQEIYHIQPSMNACKETSVNLVEAWTTDSPMQVISADDPPNFAMIVAYIEGCAPIELQSFDEMGSFESHGCDASRVGFVSNALKDVPFAKLVIKWAEVGDCGKATFASAVSQECGLNFIRIKGPESLSKCIGVSGNSVSRSEAVRCPSTEEVSIWFFIGDDSTNVTDRVVNRLLAEMDGVEGLGGVVRGYLAHTREGTQLRGSVIQISSMPHSCDPPDEEDRKEILNAVSHKVTLDASVNFKEIAGATEEFSRADLWKMPVFKLQPERKGFPVTC